MDLYAAITATASLLLSVTLALSGFVSTRRTNKQKQISLVSVTAEFVGHAEDMNPICRVVCHNRSDHAITDVYATVPWNALMHSMIPGADPEAANCVDVLTFYGVDGGDRVERTDKLIGNPVEPPPFVPGPFPVLFRATDASGVRWERGLDGRLRKPTNEMLAPRHPGPKTIFGS